MNVIRWILRCSSSSCLLLLVGCLTSYCCCSPTRLLLVGQEEFTTTTATTSSSTNDNKRVLEWQAVTNSYPGEGRHHPITFANETHAFLLTGSTSNEPYAADFYMYDEAAEKWTDLTTSATSAFPGAPRSFGYGVVLNEPDNSKAYLGFGAASKEEPLNDWWEFDMQTHVWTRLADFPGPGRRHPAMNAVLVPTNGSIAANTAAAAAAAAAASMEKEWEIHVGLGDGLTGNFNDWWAYNIRTDEWQQLPDFPSSRRHHPFYFALGSASYAGLGHSDGFDPYIERDWYRFENGEWEREADFASYRVVMDSTNSNNNSIATTEARVAGTQFSIELAGRSLGFVLSGDGDDHGTMPTGEFHYFDPVTAVWHPLPPHPGYSRWAPGSFVMRGTARAYFTSGFDRLERELHNDLWRIDLSPLFLATDENKPTSDDVVSIPNEDESTLEKNVQPEMVVLQERDASSAMSVCQIGFSSVVTALFLVVI